MDLPFLTSALDGGEWPVSCPGPFAPWEWATGTHCIRGWKGFRTGMDNMDQKIKVPWRKLNPDRLGCSLCLYQLSYSSYTLYTVWEPSMGNRYRSNNSINRITVVTCGRFPWKAPTTVVQYYHCRFYWFSFANGFKWSIPDVILAIYICACLSP
jgi:hypothetical protein